MKVFHVILIKPSHYDDDGYPIQWVRAMMPSNSLGCVRGLVLDCAERRVLGPDVEIRITPIDEMSGRVRPASLAKLIQEAGNGLVCLVGVQTNQFPRSMDLADSFRALGVSVCVGGFHVAGQLSMFGTLPPEIVAAQAKGISFFAGEAEEGRMEQVLLDAYHGRLSPLYNYLEALPGLESAPVPLLDKAQVDGTYSAYSAFDLGRGCPYKCSFCTIINVQGQKSRFRSPDDLERIIRRNHEMGVHRFFITDDNLARNSNWEACFDRLIQLREKDGIEVRLLAQVDTQSHRVRGFIDKAVAAGIDQLFVGLESINPVNLAAVRKKQNRISQYREMLLAWKKHPVVITCGYIVGLPNDTRESILRDIDVIKRELPIDHLYFTMLTPLPGSEDHKRLVDEGVEMDSDLNRYDLNHRVIHHPVMSDKEWEETWSAAWRHFYSFDHMETVFKRMAALGSNKKLTTLNRLMWYGSYGHYDRIHPLERGLVRLKSRRDRRPTLPLESRLAFYPRYALQVAQASVGMAVTYARLRVSLRRVLSDPERLKYRDAAITPPSADDQESLELYKGRRHLPLLDAADAAE